MRFLTNASSLKWLIIVTSLFFLLIVSTIGVQGQDEKFIYTRIIEVTPSVSPYSVFNPESNETYQYTEHAFDLIGEYLNLGDEEYSFYGQARCDGGFEDYISIDIVETSSDFIRPFRPPVIETMTCVNTLGSANMAKGLTQIVRTITLYTIGYSANFAEGTYSFRLEVSGGYSDEIELTATTVIIKNDEVQTDFVDYPSVWDDYSVTNSKVIERLNKPSETSIDSYVIPFSSVHTVVGILVIMAILHRSILYMKVDPPFLINYR